MPSNEQLVECLECGERKKSLAAHLTLKHKLTVQQYRQKHTKDGTGNDISIGYTLGQQPKAEKAESTEDSEPDPILGTLEDSLNPAERKLFLKKYEELFNQSSKDPSAEGTIKAICLNEILIARWWGQVLSSSVKFEIKSDFQKSINDTVKINDNLLKQLNLTRSQKEKDKRVVETTPSRYASAILDLVKNFSPEDLQRENEEVLAANIRLNMRLQEIRTYANADLNSTEFT